MIIKTLVENTRSNDNIGCEHGLSLFIKTAKHNILFDTGSTSMFADNALKMNVDLTSVDLVIISHGHFDHGGGIKTFLSINSKAKIYIKKEAFANYYYKNSEGQLRYVGIDQTLLPNERFVFLDDDFIIDDELRLFTNVTDNKLRAKNSLDLYKQNGDELINDEFVHEQHLLIKQGSKNILIAGCSHTGMVNIVNKCKDKLGITPNYVVGGFHLYNNLIDNSEEYGFVKKLGNYLLTLGIEKYYTCHCTGKDSYKLLKSIMKDKLDYLSGGSLLEL